MTRFRTTSEEETIDLGRRLARQIRRPALILLAGNLGAGKTTFTKGIVDGLGAAAPDEVSSPTFTLIHDYGAGVFHIDLYRLETEREVASLGLEELLDRDDGVILVEWGERFPGLWPAQRLTRIDINAEDDVRLFTVCGNFGTGESIQTADSSSLPCRYTE